jgi:hypothetical protein
MGMIFANRYEVEFGLISKVTVDIKFMIQAFSANYRNIYGISIIHMIYFVELRVQSRWTSHRATYMLLPKVRSSRGAISKSGVIP